MYYYYYCYYYYYYYWLHPFRSSTNLKTFLKSNLSSTTPKNAFTVAVVSHGDILHDDEFITTQSLSIYLLSSACYHLDVSLHLLASKFFHKPHGNSKISS